jgi:tetratricopeptide (TPR) repeat protein
MLRLCALVALLGVCGTARGDDNPDMEIARRHFRRGSELYQAGEYEQAIVEFKAARRAKPAPAFDFNIARCYDRLEQLDAAIEWYEHFAESKPADLAEIRTRIDELRHRRDLAPPPEFPQSPPPATAPPPATVMTPPPATVIAPRPIAQPGRPKRIAGFTLVAAGAAIAIGGVVAGVLRNQAADDLTRLDQTRDTYDPARDRAYHTDAALEGALIGVGAAAAVVGAVLTGLGYREGRRAPRVTWNAGGACARF